MQRTPGKGKNTIKIRSVQSDWDGWLDWQWTNISRHPSTLNWLNCVKDEEHWTYWTAISEIVWNRLAWRQSEVVCICSGQAELLDGLDDIDCICQAQPTISNNLTLQMSLCLDDISYDILCCTSCIWSYLPLTFLMIANWLEYYLKGSCRSSV